MKYDNLIEFLNVNSIVFEKNKSLSEMTTFKTGGPADIMAYPDCKAKISLLLKYLNDNNIKYFVLGRGSNVLALDDGYNGIIISTEKLNKIELIDETTIYCECGVSLTKLCRFALENSLSGLEFAYGIPGSVGGAVYMNAGAYGGEMKDVISVVTDISSDGNFTERNNADAEFDYRKSFYSDKNMIIFSAVYKLNKGNPNEIKSAMDELIGKRKAKQPLEYPSAGSTFKRPVGFFAGALIEECGLKGYTVGGACVSEKHAGFVINKSGATSLDILEVINHCIETVQKNKNIELEREVKILS